MRLTVGDILLKFNEDDVRLIIEALKDPRGFRSDHLHYSRCVALADRIRREAALDDGATEREGVSAEDNKTYIRHSLVGPHGAPGR